MNCIGINKITKLTEPKVTTEMSAKDNISTLVISWLLKITVWCMRSEVTIAQHFVKQRGTQTWIRSLSVSIF